MLIKLLPALALLASGVPALAQTGCPVPTLQVLRDQKAVPATGAALAPRATLQLTPGAACAGKVSYQFTRAEITLVRGRRPLVPTRVVNQPEVDLAEFMSHGQPGDRLYVEVPFKDLQVVGADGKPQPYPVPAPKPDGTVETGVGFNWLISQ